MVDLRAPVEQQAHDVLVPAAGGVDQRRVGEAVAREHRRAAVEQLGDERRAALVGGPEQEVVEARGLSWLSPSAIRSRSHPQTSGLTSPP